MSAEIKDRALSNVTVGNIDMNWTEDGDHWVGTMCHIGLCGPNGEAEGPGANVFFSVPLDASLPLRDVSRAAITRMHEILQRMASFPVAELEQRFAEWRAKEAEREKESASMGFPKSVRD